MISITGFKANKVAEFQWLIAVRDVWSMSIIKQMALIAAQKENSSELRSH
jgi:hypothetical protein